MQTFEFPLELGLISSLRLLFCFFVILVAISWGCGYHYKYKDPYEREDLAAGLQRAKLWSKIAAGISLLIMLLCALMWQDNFNRMTLNPEGSVTLSFGDQSSRTITINSTDVDSIHYGLVGKGGNCYVRIQLKNGHSMNSTTTYRDKCSDAYQALQAVFH